MQNTKEAADEHEMYKPVLAAASEVRKISKEFSILIIEDDENDFIKLESCLKDLIVNPIIKHAQTFKTRTNRIGWSAWFVSLSSLCYATAFWMPKRFISKYIRFVLNLRAFGRPMHSSRPSSRITGSDTGNLKYLMLK